jgi:hypothetical protein
MKKVISKKLLASRKRASRLWRHYRVEKKKILSKKRLPNDFKRGLISEQLHVTRQNISTTWEDYRGWKFGLFHDSPYDNFSFVKKKYTTNTEQQYYKASKNYNENNLDDQIGAILNEPGVTGVLLIFRVRDDDSELVHHVSDYITKELYGRLAAKGNSYFLYEHLSNKLKYSESVHEYSMEGIYIRIIYEKSKKRKGESGK